MKRYRGDKMESTCSNGQEPHNIATIVYYYSPFLNFGVDSCPFVGPLIPLFWTFCDVSSGFQSQSHYYSLIWVLFGAN